MQSPRTIACILACALLFASCGQASTSAPTAATAPTNASLEATAQANEEATAATGGSAEATTEPRATAAGGEAADATPLDQIQLSTELVTDDLNQPIYATHAGDGSNRLFIVEKAGRVRVLRDGQLANGAFLDITDRVGSNGSEQGLLSVAFHPNYAENGQVYVNYTDRNGDTVISRFQASGEQADAASESVLLQIGQPYANHNGGLVKFGPDGFLYIGMGDGGSAGDPQGNGQNPDALLGKLLRIDVDNGSPYAIPADNPFANGGGAAEAYGLGLRNPWRFSFDRANGNLFIADVGQNQIEEVSYQPAGSGAGANYGWNTMEGNECYDGTCDPAQFVLPVAQYTHSEGCSITGGYVYRGSAFPTLQGTYLFGDYCSGRVWGLQQNAQGWNQAGLLDSGLQISSFGEDEAGELYITSLDNNGLYRVVTQ